MRRIKAPGSGRYVATHGRTGTPEYRSWLGLVRRCRAPNKVEARYYGEGMGVTVCDRWEASFEAFYADMGPKPGPGWSIDRIDGSQGYFPDNCRWATAVQQIRNRAPVIRNTKNESGTVGVVRSQDDKNWVAQIIFRNVSVRLGVFQDYADAVKARKEAEERIRHLAPEAIPTSKEEAHALRELVRGGSRKRIVKVHTKEGLTVREFAAMLGLSDSGARDRIRRGADKATKSATERVKITTQEGNQLSIREAAELAGISKAVIRRRLRNGTAPADILAPVRQRTSFGPVLIAGDPVTIRDLADKLGLRPGTIRERIRRGGTGGEVTRPVKRGIIIGSEQMTITDAINRSGASASAIYTRIRKGLSASEILAPGRKKP